MDQLHLLWDYQQADMEVSKASGVFNRSDARQKLVKYRETIIDQKAKLDRIKEEVETMSDRLAALKDAISHVGAQISALQAKIKATPPENPDDVKQYLKEAARFQNNLVAYEQEVQRINHDMEDRAKQHHATLVTITKAKAKFDEIKPIYDSECKEQKDQLSGLKEAAEKKAALVDAEYMEHYKTIKRHCLPPMAQLIGDQCGGCNMSLPSAVSRRVKAGEIVECETCGRMLIVL